MRKVYDLLRPFDQVRQVSHCSALTMFRVVGGAAVVRQMPIGAGSTRTPVVLSLLHVTLTYYHDNFQKAPNNLFTGFDQ